jgi:hypothetical protein
VPRANDIFSSFAYLPTDAGSCSILGTSSSSICIFVFNFIAAPPKIEVEEEGEIVLEGFSTFQLLSA